LELKGICRHRITSRQNDERRSFWKKKFRKHFFLKIVIEEAKKMKEKEQI